MNKSMLEQLKKTGLVNKSQEHKVRTEKKKQAKQKSSRKKQELDVSSQSEVAQAALQKKQQRDRQLNEKQKAVSERKALNAQIKQLIEAHRQSKGVDDEEQEGQQYNFTDGAKVKHILVSRKVHQQLSQGQLAIARFEETYELVPPVVAEKILTRDPDYMIVCNEKVVTEDEDDPYKDYKVPDDLLW